MLPRRRAFTRSLLPLVTPAGTVMVADRSPLKNPGAAEEGRRSGRRLGSERCAQAEGRQGRRRRRTLPGAVAALDRRVSDQACAEAMRSSAV